MAEIKKLPKIFTKLLIISICLVTFGSIASAETGSFSIFDSNNYVYTEPGGSHAGSDYSTDLVYFRDITYHSAGLLFMSQTVTDAQFTGAAKATYDSWQESITLTERVTGTYIANGSMGYMKSGGNYKIWLWVDADTWNVSYVSGLAGAQRFKINGHSPTYYDTTEHVNTANIVLSANTYEVFFGVFGGDSLYQYDAGYYSVTSRVYFNNDYEYLYDGYSSYSVSVTKTVDGTLSPSQVYVNNSVGDILANEPAPSIYDFYMIDTNSSTPYYLKVISGCCATVHTATLDFGVSSEGTITLNKSSYTDPENIGISYDLTGADFVDNDYYIVLEYEAAPDIWSTMYTNFNKSTKLSTSTSSFLADPISNQYLLPKNIRVVIYEWDLITNPAFGTIVAESNTVSYNPITPYDWIIQGTVYDADTGNTINSALVNFSNAYYTDHSILTDPQGNYKIGVKEGYYTPSVTKAGYSDWTGSPLLINRNLTFNIPISRDVTETGTIYGVVTDSLYNTPIEGAYIKISNATFSNTTYSSSSGFYTLSGFDNSSTYTITAKVPEYYDYYDAALLTDADYITSYNFNMVSTYGGGTPGPTPTVGPTSTYPGGSGVAWTNEDITTMLRVLVPGIFCIMLIMLLLAVLTGAGGPPRPPGPGMFETVNRSYRRGRR